MAILGRVLQVIGWLWIAASVLGNFVAIDIPELNFFPGLILVFVSRVLRTQNRRRQPIEVTAGEATPTPGAPTPRPLNTERLQEPQQVVGPAKTRTPPAKSPPPAKSEVVWPNDHSAGTPEREDLIDQILVAGSELERQKAEIPNLEPSHDGKQLTSAEMIARARQRWDRKP